MYYMTVVQTQTDKQCIFIFHIYNNHISGFCCFHSQDDSRRYQAGGEEVQTCGDMKTESCDDQSIVYIQVQHCVPQLFSFIRVLYWPVFCKSLYNNNNHQILYYPEPSECETKLTIPFLYDAIFYFFNHLVLPF